MSTVLLTFAEEHEQTAHLQRQTALPHMPNHLDVREVRTLRRSTSLTAS
jgi:hypothetical protein